MFVQGFGMEGPSGLYSLQEQFTDHGPEQTTKGLPISHGITAMEDTYGYLFAYATDHTRYSTCFKTALSSSFFDKKHEKLL